MARVVSKSFNSSIGIAVAVVLVLGGCPSNAVAWATSATGSSGSSHSRS